jgi:hypothetical protein
MRTPRIGAASAVGKEKPVRAWIALLPLAAALAATSAHAKDLCVSAGASAWWRFVKVKPLKKIGAVAPLSGYCVDLTFAAPVTGTAMKRADGTILVGVYVHSQEPAISVDAAATLVVDAAFAGSGKFRDVGAGTASDIVWTAVDCKFLPAP